MFFWNSLAFSVGIILYLKGSWCPGRASQAALVVKNPTANAGDEEMQVQLPGWEDALEKAWQLTPVFLPWKIPWTEETGGLYSP